MRRMVFAGRRLAASEMLGAILVAVITMAMSVAYVGYGLTQAQAQTASISEVLRASAKAQRQLLSLSYYYRNGANLYAYIYNMGSEVSTLKTVFVGPNNVTAAMQLKNAVTGTPIGNREIPPKTLVELNASSSAGQLDLLIITEEGGIFIWRLNL